MVMDNDFREIGHCGGKLRINVEIAEDGRQAYSIGYSTASAGPAGLFMIYALPPGIPVATIPAIGMGQGMPEPPVPGCIPVIVSSDSQGRFGHQCQRCRQYWRSDGAPAFWPMTCPYCGLRQDAHAFLTEGQRAYVQACCALVQEAINAGEAAEVDLDRIADTVVEGEEPPKFYYAEKSQQKRFTCPACGGWNDILGRFGYCSSCGTRNETQELEATVAAIRERVNDGGACEAAVKDAVSVFDAVARKYVDQLVGRVPMTNARRNKVKDQLFHNLKARAADLKMVFDIDIFSGLKAQDIDFAALMFHRRHVYEHNGGEADAKYISESGDTSVAPKQMIRETMESAHRIAALVTKMVQNLHAGFHDIFPPHPTPLKIEADRRARMKAAR